jgi:hypothetical protein
MIDHCLLCCSQDHIRTRTCDLNHPVSYVPRRGFAAYFPLDVPIVHSSALAVSTDDECLMCVGFSLGETIRFGSLEFIAGYCGGLSLSPIGNDSGATFMGSPRNMPLTLRWSMIVDSIEEFFTASSGEGGSGLPSSRRHGTVAPSASVTTMPWLEDALATQAMTTILPRILVPQLNTDLPFK